MRIITFILIHTVFITLHLTMMSANASPIQMTAVKQVKQAPDFTLNNAQGKPLSLSDFKGKYVLVNFWAHWCPPCIKEFPSMQTLYEQLNDQDFEIIAIHAGEFADDLDDFLSKAGTTFPVVEDANTSLGGWDVPALPTTYLVDPNGNIIYKAIGPREWDAKAIKKLFINTP